jgi:hypothetical protein
MATKFLMELFLRRKVSHLRKIWPRRWKKIIRIKSSLKGEYINTAIKFFFNFKERSHIQLRF